jgi:hypothetical protein
MEQTNLVVTPDGKTWDEVTREVSYIGDIVLMTHLSSADSTVTPVVYDEWRGLTNKTVNAFNKDFAIAYDRMICLKDGYYRIRFHHLMGLDEVSCSHYLTINGSHEYNVRLYTYNPADTGNPESIQGSYECILKRGDYIQHTHNQQLYANDPSWGNFAITRI